jgi:hypothetical protein
VDCHTLRLGGRLDLLNLQVDTGQQTVRQRSCVRAKCLAALGRANLAPVGALRGPYYGRTFMPGILPARLCL